MRITLKRILISGEHRGWEWTTEGGATNHCNRYATFHGPWGPADARQWLGGNCFLPENLDGAKRSLWRKYGAASIVVEG